MSMTKYTLYQKKNRINPEKDGQWHAEPSPSPRMEGRELAKLVTQGTTLSYAELELALQLLADRLPALLARGLTVGLGELGTLRLEFGSPGVDRPEDFDPRLIRRPRIVFRPARSLGRETLERVRFEQDGLVAGGVAFGSVQDYRAWQEQEQEETP